MPAPKAKADDELREKLAQDEVHKRAKETLREAEHRANGRYSSAEPLLLPTEADERMVPRPEKVARTVSAIN